ncbi:WG repeat-containing protein [Prevotella sp. 10(H)]|uniref:WG repeat-containing protein n=1 Tax=Prevotella sp. 10(H) TaxID=1158294 RepID=UPI0004A7659E|nr:WG repeat-containing protein [Prevotella sp. 10(H)]
MKKLIFTAALLCSIALMQSCISHKKYVFGELGSLQSLNGTYVNKENYITRAFNIRNNEIDLVKIEFAGADSLNMYCLTDSGYVHYISRRGKVDYKKNYFELVFERSRKIFIVMNNVSNDKVRLGKDMDGKLLVNKIEDSWGNFFILPGGYDYDFGESIDRVEDNMLIPVRVDYKWGYTDNRDNVVIEPKYEFVRLFDGDVACVRLDGKWGLIDRNGTEIVPPKYKKIAPFNGASSTRAYLGFKEGFINREGKEVVPVIYDKIGYLYEGDSIAVSELDGKYGIVSPNRVIFPPMFDKADAYINTDSKYFREMRKKLSGYLGEVVIGDKSYMIDEDGYLYEFKNDLWSGSKINYESRRHWTAQPLPKADAKEQQSVHQLLLSPAE